MDCFKKLIGGLNMYFPYFRGRQYELLALKELALKKLISDLVVPIVEPIKLTSTFDGTIKAYTEANLPIALVLNPSVGDFTDADITPLFSKIVKSVIPAVLLNDSTEETTNNLNEKGIAKSQILAVLNSRDYIDDYKELFTDEGPQYSLFPDERQIRRAINKNKVLFEDKFKKQTKNSDYKNNDDEFL